MKKILIFGFTGFIGINLKKFLKNYIVYAVENTKKIKKEKNIIPVKINLDTLKDINIYKNKIDYIINLAWYKIPNFTKNINDFNITLNKKIINFSKQINAKKVFFAGSCFEYDHKNKFINETSKVTDSNKLGLTKLIIKKYAEKILKRKLIWGRIFYAYGPHQRSGSILKYAKNMMKQKKKINLKNPYMYLDYIHVNEVCSIILLLLEKNKFGTYNICSGKPEFNKNFIEKELKIKINENYNRNTKVTGFFGCNKKISEIKELI